MKIWRCNHSQAFTLVEAVVCAAAVLILSGIVVHRVRDARSNAQTARYKANANQLQLAYERTKFAYPGMLTIG